ncbi:hypothetical protein A3A20_02965 [Candidatus Wolfebacteria bacterium RIFCSPLOWO2_01_FULL_45_19]|uniref:Uncharacterized protein n=1 Tax=Candidatus Wolfebacteria bacterium RIFCSPLOWO2_01_FULL_45_19 TaxID=1802557 RepID=A0A1F8DQR3_9BACT|nr:MAG: hypothetical protein UX23_C0008G0040 [Parcubacteria group bacterium GW2011_GWB1_45_9]OGM90756.1 MAG: hypothetical protein A3A20_02965 [Candidatus Wolfebacteria bacterium RIFCSPLOWO2_01_FULL_45_19]
MLKKTIVASVALSLLAIPMLSLAQVPPPPASPITGISDVIRVLNTFVAWMFAILMVLAVIFILYAAFLYLTAGGDAEKVSTANKQLIYAAVAIGVALISQGVRILVEQFLRA